MGAVGRMNRVYGSLRESCLNSGDQPAEESPNPCKKIKEDIWGVMAEVGPMMTGADMIILLRIKLSKCLPWKDLGAELRFIDQLVASQCCLSVNH